MEKYRETKTTADWNGMIHKLCENRLYMGILLLTAGCAYGYKVTNVTIGIDDTPSLYYFQEGLIAIVGGPPLTRQTFALSFSRTFARASISEVLASVRTRDFKSSKISVSCSFK